MAKRTVNSSTSVEIDDAAGNFSYHYADEASAEPGALVVTLQLAGSPKRFTKVISKVDLGKNVKIGEFLAALAAESLA
jgi:hypothetical protein